MKGGREEKQGGGAAPPLPLYILEQRGSPTHDSISLLAQPYPSPSSSLVVLGEALLESRAPPPPPRRRANGTLPRHFAGSESGDRHRAERVLKLGGAVVSVLDRSGHEDV